MKLYLFNIENFSYFNGIKSANEIFIKKMESEKGKKKGLAWKYLFKEIFFVFFYVILMLPLIFAGSFGYLMAKTPLGNSLETRKIAQTSIIYDRTGQHVLYEMHGDENRKIISHNEIPDNIRIATIASEDDRFYSHFGIDIPSVVRAVKTDLEKRSLSQGASTITQQLARNVYLTRQKTFRRKILEAVYAIKIERKYSKADILDAYLNQVPYGSNASGIEAASETYFQKPAKDLTLDEAAMLSAMTKATTYYSPYGNHKDELVKRQKWILQRIGQLKLADQSLVDAALSADTLAKIAPYNEPIDAPHFVFYVRDYLEKKYGKEMMEQGGLRIYTSLDWDKQKLAENILSSDIPRLKSFKAENAALTAVDPKTGQILVMAGSVDYFSKTIDGQVNVTTSPRQPGSSFKPIVYAKAFEDGYQPETLVLDTTTDFGPDGSGRHYIPRNYDGRSHGVVSMRSALGMSLNIPAVKTLRAVGIDDAISMAHRLGITTLNDRKRYGLALVIGGGEVTLLDETSAFSVFANDGKRNPVDPILKITDSKGNIIQENQPENKPVLDPQVARKVNSVLSDNGARTPIFGPNSKLYVQGYQVAAKSGTTQENRDAWTVGYTPDIAVGVWAGNNDNRPMRFGADGSYVAAPIWNQFMSSVIKTYPRETFLAYDRTGAEPDNGYPDNGYYDPGFNNSQSDAIITYYRISDGKRISERKARKLDPNEVRKEIRYRNWNGDSVFGSVDSTYSRQPVL